MRFEYIQTRSKPPSNMLKFSVIPCFRRTITQHWVHIIPCLSSVNISIPEERTVLKGRAPTHALALVALVREVAMATLIDYHELKSLNVMELSELFVVRARE